MAEQRWFAGLPVVGQRRLDSGELERLTGLARSIQRESLGSYALLLAAILSAITSTTVSMTTGWFGVVVFGVTMGLFRYVPQRRFFSPRIILQVRRDLEEPCVDVCAREEMTLEVLSASHIIWSRNGVAVEPPTVAHGTSTAIAPHHAAMAAEFVRPAEDGAPFYLHQRALTADELEELESYAPRPLFVIQVLAIVGVVGCLSTLALTLSGRLTTLLPSFLFLVVATWAGIVAFRQLRARRIIARDLETGFVVIIRSHENGVLGAPDEILPFSNFVWTRNGQTTEWRKRLRRR